MTLDSSAVPFLTLIAVGIIALMISVLLKSLVDRRIDLARREYEALDNTHAEGTSEPFWLRYGEPVKRSIQGLAWMLVGLGFLNLISYLLTGASEHLAQQKDGSLGLRMADDVQRLSLWIKQGADVLLRIVVVAIAGVWVARFLHGAMRGLVNGGLSARALPAHPRSKVRTETLLTSSGYVINVAVFAVCLLMGLQMLGVSVAPLLATAGVASVAIGFGAQSLVRDLLAGFFILSEDQFAVGDVITIDGRSGTVESLTLRCTKLRLSDGALLVIPNGEIKKIENATSGFSQIDYRVTVLFGEQLEQASALLNEEIQRLAKDYSQDVVAQPEFLGVDSVKESNVVLRARIRTKPGRQYTLERELNQRLLKQFLAFKILLPSNK